MIGFPPKGNSVKEKVLNNIIDKIQYLELAPGEIINENSFEGDIGASRTPRREAMMLLEMEGLVNIYPQKGTYVALIDLKLIREIIYLRLTLETKIFTELAEMKTPVMQYVEKFLLIQELSAKNNDFVEFVKNDYLFHRELFKLAGHIEVWNIIEGKLIHCTRFRVLGWKTVREEFNLMLSEHKKISESIESGNIESLKSVLESHHDYNLKRYADILIKNNPEFFTRQS
ncbi:GntR family transcriptional regulator [Lachnospiraceae bacterium NSJ-143]|nr:GntR family transcriptional regulator [Lachnospiraceae bacterium NSJ-143]